MAKFIKSKFRVLWATVFSFFYGFFSTDLLAQEAADDAETEDAVEENKEGLDPGAIAAAVAAAAAVFLVPTSPAHLPIAIYLPPVNI